MACLGSSLQVSQDWCNIASPRAPSAPLQPDDRSRLTSPHLGVTEDIVDGTLALNLGAKYLFVCIAQPSTHFTAHVHLNHGELFDVLFINLIEIGHRYLDRGAIFQREHGRASWKQIHYRHFPEAVSLFQFTQQVLLAFPRLHYRDLAGLQHEQRVAHICFAKEILTAAHTDNRREAEQKFQCAFTQAAEDGHTLQQFKPCLFHDGAYTVVRWSVSPLCVNRSMRAAGPGF